jgi:hypothetical protein
VSKTRKWMRADIWECKLTGVMSERLAKRCLEDPKLCRKLLPGMMSILHPCIVDSMLDVITQEYTVSRIVAAFDAKSILFERMTENE